MKTIITRTADNEVTVEYDNIYEGRVTRRFFVPLNGGYVRERGGSMPQVCEQLANTGNTLSSSPEGLIALIRREYRALRRAEKREARFL